MTKHINGVLECPSCEVKLRQAHPDIAAWFRDHVKPQFQDCHVSWSFRGKEDQEKAFLDGKSKLHFPLSAHNKCDDQGNPCSMALDLFRLDMHGLACWEWGYFRDIANVAAHDPASMATYDGLIKWGGLWTSIGDSDHMELTKEKNS